ncbi:unnamed protein product [Allacma fusca]|uniref:Bicarbonate transporter-like transmembrane domain-containing protein n=1 Tax=Allacma fusca TaxID=39272 RepID=A0A8J2JAR7_9HEXA|nr:unnamed protein product [Allacma fusca]
MVEAVKNVAEIKHHYPINPHATNEKGYSCECIPGNESLVNSTWDDVSFEECEKPPLNGILIGEGCKYYPDVFLMSVLLFIGTFIISIMLKDFRSSSFFPSKVRQVVSDFAVIIAIISMSCIDIIMGLRTPKLQVPEKFQPTLPSRGWFVDPFGNNPVWTIFAAPLPAVLATILIFMDQQITAVIINRKEHKLKKGCGYHLDLFVLALLIILCSFMGIPWFVAATVLSMNHVNSLKMESESAAPGEKPQFLGVREQRCTHILIFVMIGLSVTITPVLKNIPMPVLYGVFLYMGFASLKGMQFFERLLIIFMPTKYQPDYMYLRQVPLLRVHLFTIIQLACLIMLWLVKSFKTTSILFPVMLVVMLVVRKLLDYVFSQRELKILDDIMPETSKRKEKDDLKEAFLENETTLTIGESGNFKIPLSNGNVMKIPLSAVNITEEVNKNGSWKPVKNSNTKDSSTRGSGSKKDKLRNRGNITDAISAEERRRLSVMNEEDEDGITMKLDRPSV